MAKASMQSIASAPKDQSDEPTPVPVAPVAPSAPALPRWRVKHPMFGHEIALAATADAAKEVVLRRRFPMECEDARWLEGMKSMSMRVARLPN